MVFIARVVAVAVGDVRASALTAVATNAFRYSVPAQSVSTRVLSR